MAEDRHDAFLPDEIDEQINEHLSPDADRLQPTDDPSSLRTVQLLKRYYNTVPSEEEAVLRRVWEELEAYRASNSTPGDDAVQSKETLLHSWRRYHMQSTYETKPDTDKAKSGAKA